MKKYIFGFMILSLVACKDEKQSNTQTPAAQVAVQQPVVQQPVKAVAQVSSAALDKFSWPAVKNNDVVLSEDLLKENYYIIFDGSGSMNDRCNSTETKVEVGKKAISQFVKNIDKNSNIGMMVFDAYGTNERVPLSVDRQSLYKEIEKIYAKGDTPLGKSIEIAYTALEKQAIKQLGYGDYNIVVITDGEASDMNVMKKNLGVITEKTPINIYTLGFCIDSGHVLNQPGKVTYYSANNYEQLAAGLNKIIAESNTFKN